VWINAAQSDLACLVTGDTKLAGLLGLNMRLLLRRGLVSRPPCLARGWLALAQGGAYVVKRGWLALEIGFAVGALAPTLSYVAPPLVFSNLSYGPPRLSKACQGVVQFMMS